MCIGRKAANRIAGSGLWILGFAAIMILTGCATPTRPQAARDLHRRESRTHETAPQSMSQTHAAKEFKALEDAVKSSPDDAGAHYRLGNALFDQKRFEEACVHYDEAARLDPQHMAALCNKGLCLRNLGKRDEALAAYRAALDIQPNDEVTLQNMVVLLLDGDPGELLEPLQRLSAMKPEDVDVNAELAKVLYRTERYKEGIAAFKRLIDLDPGFADDYYNLGLCYFNLEQYDNALTTWLTALAYDRKNPSVRKGLAVAYWKRKDYDRAWQAVRECQRLGISLDPEFLQSLQRDSRRAGPSS